MVTSAQVMRVTRPCLVLAVVIVDCVLVGLLPGPWNYYWLFAVGCWAVLNLYWAWSARHTMPVLTRWSWPLWLISVVEFLLCCLPLSSVPILGGRFAPRFAAVESLGATVCAVGVGFAIWSRHVLDGNWNNVASLRAGHVLVQAGPYAIVRHPIYLGFMLSAVGMMLALGEVRALVLVTDLIVFFRRMKPEESVLLSTYPNEYPAYERRVKRLLPYVW